MDLSEKIKLLPSNPGVYQFRDENNKIIYIGKAKSLRNRVRSYFLKNGGHSGRTRVMVKRIKDFSFIVVESELDALLLENNLIKQYQPRYNVMLKDDKTYPWICIKHERFPRIFATRTKINDGSEYFGPYASVGMMKTLLNLIRQLYKIRTCKYDLSEKNIALGKFKVCLEYHIGNCKGPCEGLQSLEDYMLQIADIKEIIKGNIGSVITILENRMNAYSEKMEYESAFEIKENIDILHRYKSKSTIVNPAIGDVDVLSVISDLHNGYVNYLKVVDGAVIQSHTMAYKKKLEESDADLLQLGIAEVRVQFNALAKEILIPEAIDMEMENHHFTIPQRGDKKKLLELSTRNAKYFMLDKQKQTRFADPEKHTERIMVQMQKDLRLSEKPAHIECFDNSNFQGTNAVAACVVFRDGKPSKKEYRHFNIKTVVGPDDFASMKEVVFRRYRRMIDEGESLPQLIVVDGGKGQLSSALESLDELGIRGKVAIIGIAKRLEEIFYPGDSAPLYIDKKSETLKILQNARNEAHRFGITHHRNKRSKNTFKTELTDIPGIGKGTAEDLLKKFQSVTRVKKATLAEISEAIGPSKAQAVRTWFNLDSK
ncbi:excinuclease ABC subunit UvrC [Cryomorpha ignava]|uniref:UvrABC system protein C n=1 Tax=Cryomorpha ignava TaxID=101383 RepID=A0A7K3WKM9_9FLAO|nr:excinuclease ABC subunit UvrC [Cryomorpha ignava]NEN22088.1 excinuclease ABC subunit UvrC [Cryomorpha ignava]